MEIIKNANPDGTYIETVVWEEDGVIHSVLKSVYDAQQAATSTLPSNSSTPQAGA